MAAPANKVIRVHQDEGVRTGLVVSQGPRWIHIIWPDSAGIRIRKISVDSRITEIDYPIKRAKQTLRRCGKNFGITKSAKIALRG